LFTIPIVTEQEVCTSDGQDTMDAQNNTTDNDVQDNINQWVLSITDEGTEKNKKKKHKCKQCDVVEATVVSELDGYKNTESAAVCTDVPLKSGKKKSKSREKDVNQVAVEDNEVIVVERKKKRNSKTIIDAPVEKKTKLQANDETEKPSVKKHKKKKTH